MKKPGPALLMMYDWFAPFYERVLPKTPPKVPTRKLIEKAAVIAYDADHHAVPACHCGGFPKGTTPKVMRDIIIYRLAEWACTHAPQIEQYMIKVYGVNIVFQDGDPTSHGKRIVPNRDTEENLRAIEAQAAWDDAHCRGTHEREDYMAEQINRLQPKAGLQRHKLVNLPLPKPGGKKR